MSPGPEEAVAYRMMTDEQRMAYFGAALTAMADEHKRDLRTELPIMILIVGGLAILLGIALTGHPIRW